ncbi:MAG: hypothetical protein ACOYL6_15920 [Bacteriovoracaceae bacterium]
MKHLHRFLLTFLLISNTFAADVCLQSASNNELLTELSRRLTSPQPQPVLSSAFMSYSCRENSGPTALTFTAVNSLTGVETKAEFWTGSIQACNENISILSSIKARIFQSTMIAGCNWVGRGYGLSKKMIFPDGQIKDLSQKIYDQEAQCEAQAKLINSTL